MDYLSYIILKEGVLMVMIVWLILKFVKEFCSFLGLVEYYICFMKLYGFIVRLLIDLLKIDIFVWN